MPIVDEIMLQIDVKGAEKDDTFKTGRYRGKGAQSFAPDTCRWHYRPEELGLDPVEPMGKEVLLFEFVDEDLKRQATE